LKSPYTLPTAADEGGRTATSSSTPGGTTSEAEDRLIARYRLEVFDGDTPAADRGYPTVDTPLGIGHRTGGMTTEPPYNELFWVHLAEGIHTYPVAGQGGPVAYFVWRIPVDFENPPAAGGPPSELLDGRAELDRIANQ
jgi:hypothetical protein